MPSHHHPLDLLTPQNISSFAGFHKEVVLQPGTMLFRFCRNVQYKYSDCWTDKDTIKQIFESYHRRRDERPDGLKRAQVRAQVFNTLAIAKSWSNLEYLLVIEVKKPLVAYEGAIKEQSFFQDVEADSELRKVKVYGGGKQYVIPRIKNYASTGEIQQLHTYIRDFELVRFTESSWYKRLVTAGYNL